MGYMKELAMVADQLTAFDMACYIEHCYQTTDPYLEVETPETFAGNAAYRAAFFSGIIEAVPDYFDLNSVQRGFIIDHFQQIHNHPLADMLLMLH